MHSLIHSSILCVSNWWTQAIVVEWPQHGAYLKCWQFNDNDNTTIGNTKYQIESTTEMGHFIMIHLGNGIQKFDNFPILLCGMAIEWTQTLSNNQTSWQCSSNENNQKSGFKVLKCWKFSIITIFFIIYFCFLRIAPPTMFDLLFIILSESGTWCHTQSFWINRVGCFK